MPPTHLSYRGMVYPWHCDHMGHMNVMWYVGKFDEATWHLLASIGLTPAYLREQQRGMVAVQQNLTYKHELLAGDLITIHSGFLEVRNRSIRFFHEMRNEVTQDVAAIAILTGVHTDAVTRTACPLPADIAARGQEKVTAYELP